MIKKGYMKLEEALLLFIIVFLIVFFTLLFLITVTWFLYRLYRIRISPKRTGTQEEQIADVLCRCFQRKTLIVRKPFAKSSVFCRCGKFLENLDKVPQDGIYVLHIGNTSQSFDIVFQERFSKDPLYLIKIQEQDCKSIKIKKGYYHSLTGRIGFYIYLDNYGITECRGYVILEKVKDSKIDLCFKGIYKTKWKTGNFELFLSTNKIDFNLMLKNNNRKKSFKKYPKREDTDTKIIHEKSECYCMSVEDNKCIICYDKDIDCIVVPCQHLCICSKCAEQLKQSSEEMRNPSCPLCRTEIGNIIIPE